jgi:hypothetical protein
LEINPAWLSLLSKPCYAGASRELPSLKGVKSQWCVRIENWRGRDGNDPSFDIAKDAERRF